VLAIDHKNWHSESSPAPHFCGLIMCSSTRCKLVLFFFLCINILSTFGASKTKPHTHQGMLEPYDGKHIPYSLTKEQNKDLNDGKPVTINQRNGKSGRGIVIQDIQAPPNVCLSRISDLANYSKMVPNVKSIEIYDNEVGADGSTKTGAMFKVGVSIVTFGYYLRLKYDPSYMTYTWTLDYQYNSDFGKIFTFAFYLISVSVKTISNITMLSMKNHYDENALLNQHNLH
jgi:hypothetical protein